jgi:LEA14-like dessication related protein
MIKRPSIRVSNLEIRNLSFSSADLALHMEFENPNAFGIRINEFDYGLTINADQWAQGKSLANTLISEKGSSRLTIPLSLNISEIGLSAYRLLSGTEDLNYSLKGTFNLGTTHPLLDQTDWNVNRSGSLSLTGN